jgi:hypothetical protein
VRLRAFDIRVRPWCDLMLSTDSSPSPLREISIPP